jgi:hypothetical protein
MTLWKRISFQLCVGRRVVRAQLEVLLTFAECDEGKKQIGDHATLLAKSVLCL